MAWVHCPECGWTFTSQERLRRHRLGRHGVSATVAAGSSGVDAGPASPEAPAPPGGRVSGWLVFLGYLSAVLLPIAGVGLGIMLLLRRRVGHGIAVTLIALAVIVTVFASRA